MHVIVCQKVGLEPGPLPTAPSAVSNACLYCAHPCWHLSEECCALCSGGSVLCRQMDRRTDMHAHVNTCMHACMHLRTHILNTCTHAHIHHWWHTCQWIKDTMLVNLMHTTVLSLSCCTFSALEYSIFMCTKVRGKGNFSIRSLP